MKNMIIFVVSLDLSNRPKSKSHWTFGLVVLYPISLSPSPSIRVCKLHIYKLRTGFYLLYIYINVVVECGKLLGIIELVKFLEK